MRPQFANAFGIARNANKNGQTVELQLDFMLQYMDSESQLTNKRPVSASVRKSEPLSSVLLTRDGVAALIATLRRTLGSEFDDIVAFCEAQDEMKGSL